MDILFLLPRFFPYRGGYENSMLGLSRYLVSHGHRVTVFTTVADDLEALWLPCFRTFPPGQDSVQGITVRRFPISYNRWSRRASRLLGLLPSWRLRSRFWRPGFAVLGLAEALRSATPDLIHIGPLPYNSLMYAGLRAAAGKRIPVVSTPCTHFGEERSTEIAQQYVQPHQIALLQHCDKVLCMMESERARLQELGVPPAKLAVASHGVTMASVTGGDGERIRRKYGIDGPVVLHVGMKAYDKGSVTLLEAMKRLWSQGSAAWLIMAGPSLTSFDDYIESSGSFPRLINLPPFSEDEKPDLLASADVVVQPSRVESLGLVLIEAWANAKPVIAADIRVSRELITECHGGAVVPFGESVPLAECIATMLGQPELRVAMGQRGRQFVLGRYESSLAWERNRQVLESVLQDSGKVNKTEMAR